MSYTPRHRRSMIRRRLASGVATAATLGTVLVVAASPASAFDNFTQITANDGASIGRCALTVTNADYSAGTVRLNLNASARAAKPIGLINNSHVAVRCDVYSNGFGSLLMSVGSEADGSYTSRSAIQTVPLFADYEVCVSVNTTLRSGPTIGAGNCT